uniref:Uncharacterized protein n=1 Tax=Rhizophora mucronata TaxID=61149 RepID=A0A2P2PUS5_RHIMU
MFFIPIHIQHQTFNICSPITAVNHIQQELKRQGSTQGQNTMLHLERGI